VPPVAEATFVGKTVGPLSLNQLKVSPGYFKGESLVPVPGLSIESTYEPPEQNTTLEILLLW
jgi:hypothetical protein